MSSPQFPTVDSLSRQSTVLDHQLPVLPRNVPELPRETSVEKNSDPFLVQFDPSDPARPRNWPLLKKLWTTAFAAILVLNASFASAAPSGIASDLMREFKFSEEIATLTISVFVAGYCVGPILWGPLSEQYGRKPIFSITFLFYTAFQVGSALSKNTASIIIFRLLGGIFAAAPLGNSGAVVADIWDASERGKAIALFTVAPFAGPALAPTVSGFISVTGTDFRWLFWVLTIFAGVCLVLIVLTLDESYEPVLLVKLAQIKRKETGDERYYAPMEAVKMSRLKRIDNIVVKPFRILFSESMLIAITAYMSFVYGCLYLLFEAYPIVFTIGHHLNTGLTGLTFIPIFVGGVVGVAGYLLIYNPRYEKLVAQYSPKPVPPEARLDVALWAAPLFAISFFWFGWTSYPRLSVWAPLTSGLAFGWSVVWIFLGLFNYTIDAYLEVAASALAVSTVTRSLFGASFPLFATQMYNTLNPRWGSTLLGAIAVLGIPIPIILKRYGPTLRSKSKYAPATDIQQQDESEKV